MTYKRRLGFSFLLLIWLGSSCFSADILISLDAAKLPPGPLASWPNLGSLGGSFNTAKTLPVVEMVAEYDRDRWGLISNIDLKAIGPKNSGKSN